MKVKEFVKKLMQEKNPKKQEEMYRNYINTHPEHFHELVEEKIKEYETKN
jgi:hypothetical protein